MARVADPRVRRIIARNLRRVVANHGLGLGDVANDLKMPQAQLSGYMRNHRGFSIETLLRFAVGLGCSIDELLYDVNPEYNKLAFRNRLGVLDEDLATAVDVLRPLTRAQRQKAIDVVATFAAAVQPSQSLTAPIGETALAANTRVAPARRPRVRGSKEHG